MPGGEVGGWLGPARADKVVVTETLTEEIPVPFSQIGTDGEPLTPPHPTNTLSLAKHAQHVGGGQPA